MHNKNGDYNLIGEWKRHSKLWNHINKSFEIFSRLAGDGFVGSVWQIVRMRFEHVMNFKWMWWIYWFILIDLKNSFRLLCQLCRRPSAGFNFCIENLFENHKRTVLMENSSFFELTLLSTHNLQKLSFNFTSIDFPNKWYR